MFKRSSVSNLTCYDARDIAGMSISDVWNLPDEDIRLTFDDGTIDTSMRETWYSRYAWEIHNQYPKTPMLKSQHIEGIRITPTTHISLMGSVFFTCVETYKALGTPVNKEDLCRIIYKSYNRLFNDTITLLPEYVGTISVLDFLDIYDHPNVVEAYRVLHSKEFVTPEDIDECYNVIKTTTYTAPELTNGNLASALKSAVVKMDQALQNIGPRGFVSDSDGHIFRNPILTGYLEGHVLLKDSMKDSRSAAIALHNQTEPMKQSESFNKMLQLSSANLPRLHQQYDNALIDHLEPLLSPLQDYDHRNMIEDCGSTDYHIQTVASKKDLVNMAGISFWNEDTQKLEKIKDNRTELIGRTLKMRLAPSCKINDRGGVCLTCYGDVGIGLPIGSNVGYVSCTAFNQKTTQNLLSTKHLLRSMVADQFVIRQGDKKYIENGGKDSILINHRLQGKTYYLYFPEACASTLQDLKYIDDAKSLSPWRMSELENIRLSVKGNDGVFEFADIEVSANSRLSSFSIEMLSYIKDKGWDSDENGNYIVDMSDWDVTSPFLVLPLKQFSMIEYVLRIKKCIQGGSGGRDVKPLRGYDTVNEAITGLYDLVSLKLDVNLSHLATIILTLMAEDVANNDYRLPKDKMKGEIVQYKDSIRMRSLSAMLAYQHQFDILYSPSSTLYTNRTSHPLDALIFG